MAPKKKRQREAARRRVERWCAEHGEFMQHVEQAMFYAMKDGESVTEAGVQAILTEHGLELPFSVSELMKHW
jgi:predicted TIM-barrel enzyme